MSKEQPTNMHNMDVTEFHKPHLTTHSYIFQALITKLEWRLISPANKTERNKIPHYLLTLSGSIK